MINNKISDYKTINNVIAIFSGLIAIILVLAPNTVANVFNVNYLSQADGSWINSTRVVAIVCVSLSLLASWARYIDEVYAQGAVMIDRKVKKVPDYDTASMILKSKKGILCQLSNSRRQTGGFDQRIEVYCKKGNLNLTNIKKTSVQEINSKSEVFDNYPLSFIERYKESYVRAIEGAKNISLYCSNEVPIPALVILFS